MSSVQRPATTPAAAIAPATGADLGGTRCPECLERYARQHPLQLFCTPAHRDAWNNRAAVRARVTLPLEMVARLTHNGSRGSDDDRAVGRRASSQLAYLINRYRDEDAAAGRMPWPAYLRLRYAIGFDPL